MDSSFSIGTVEMPTTTTGKTSKAFLKTNNAVIEDGKIEVGVYRKAAHTSKYLDFHSHSPEQSKRAVVKTSIDRAKCIHQQLHNDSARRDVSSTT